MQAGRRRFVIGLGVVIANALLGVRHASACLYGTWFLYCRNCRNVDTVTAGTCQHVCENEACERQVFYGKDGREVTLVCGRGHLNPVTTGTRDKPTMSHKCTTCGDECQQGRSSGSGGSGPAGQGDRR